MTTTPRYPLLVSPAVRRFRCIGGDCPDTCCIGWSVVIDRGRARSLRIIDDPDLAPKLARAIPDPDTVPPNEPLRITMSESGRCHMLLPSGYCELHSRLGEDALPDVCRLFPRRDTVISGVHVQSLSLSCPEAARLVLEASVEENPFQLIEGSDPVSGIFRHLSLGELLPGTDLTEPFWQLQVAIVTLLRQPDVPVFRRLVALGLFSRTIEDWLTDERRPSFPVFLEEWNQSVRLTLDEALAPPPQPALEVHVLKEIVTVGLKVLFLERQYLAVLQELDRVLHLTSRSPAEILPLFEEGDRMYREPFLARHSSMIENYLLNEFSPCGFPFGLGKHVFENFAEVAIPAALLRGQLAALGVARGRLTPPDVIELVRGFSRLYSHNQTMRDHIKQLLQQARLTTFPGLLGLLC